MVSGSVFNVVRCRAHLARKFLVPFAEFTCTFVTGYCSRAGGDLLATPDRSGRAVHKAQAPVRQTEIAELMVSASNFTDGYAEALFIGTPKSQLNTGTVSWPTVEEHPNRGR